MRPSPVFLALYSLGWKAARIFLRQNSRLKDGWSNRLVPDNWAGPCDVWFQAASGGECYLIHELVHELARDGQKLRFLLTTWTRQGMDVLTMTRSDLEVHAPESAAETAFFPLDDPALMRRAIRQVSPRLIVVLETELWPGLFAAAKEAGVPILVLNGRLTKRSADGYAKLGLLSPRFWERVAPVGIAALSRGDGSRFAAIFPDTPIKVLPNIKFDRAEAKACSDTGEVEAFLPKTDFLRLLASVRQEEEHSLLPVIAELSGYGGLTVVAPRHLHRIPAWEQGLGDLGIVYGKRSDGRIAPDARVILWDRFGELNQLYALADTVFVGGSLADLGGQNILEPLAHGRIPCVGPFTDNFSWATDGPTGLKASHLMRTCADGTSLIKSLSERPGIPRAAVAEAFAGWLAPHRGGTCASADLIRDVLSASRP